jgi:hypothetical protein
VLNDGAGAPARLRCDLNMGTLWQLPDWSTAPKGEERDVYGAIRGAGYEGTQLGDAALSQAAGLACTAMATLREPGTLDGQVSLAKTAGFECVTAHVGTGMESDAEALALLNEVLDAVAKHEVPVYVETHRATVTQDIRRTVDFVEVLPDLRFNGDFSHWYTGLELVYGDFDAKLDFIEPVFERTCFLHGRIGDPGCIQIDIGDGDPATHPSVTHFREMWTRAMAGFLRDADQGDVFVFAPELLPSMINYARMVPDANGGEREEGDRWTQALLYCEIAKECWAAAAGSEGVHA